MTDKILLTNRIIALITIFPTMWLCDKWNLQPHWNFLIAIGYIIGMNFVFAIVEAIFKE